MSKSAHQRTLERLDALKERLTSEVASAAPSVLYIGDLQESIADLEQDLAKRDYEVVS